MGKPLAVPHSHVVYKSSCRMVAWGIVYDGTQGLAVLNRRVPDWIKQALHQLAIILKKQNPQRWKKNLPNSLTELSKEPPTVTNFSPDVELETINLSDDPDVQWQTLVNATLPLLEKAHLISLLKEYIDVFVWEYNEMPSLDPNLVHMLLTWNQGRSQ